MTFQIELVSPEAITYQGEADMVIARTVGGGDIAFQPGHVPFIGVLAIWSVEIIRPDGGRDTFAVHRGFVQVAGTKVSILSDVSEAAAEIDADRARAALSVGGDDPQETEARSRAEVRLRVAGAEACPPRPGA